jgi:hypothetical protein
LPASVALPRRAARSQSGFPGVLFQMGHTPNGKAGDSYQRCCQCLVKLGYVLLGFDPMGQGERVFYPDSSGQRSRLASPDSEHTTPGRPCVRPFGFGFAVDSGFPMLVSMAVIIVPARPR